MINSRTYRVGVFLSLLSTAISIIGSLYVYRILWKGASVNEFAIWFTFIELSQLFLLADVGFTQDFIRRVLQGRADFDQQLASVRGKLYIASVISAVLLAGILVATNPEPGVPLLGIVLIVASTIFTLLSYAETAFLRAKERFIEVYVINILGSAVFILVIVFYYGEPLLAIAWAIFSRAVLQFGFQVAILKQSYQIAFDALPIPSRSVLAYNAPYMCLFLLDGIILFQVGITSGLIAAVLLVKKLFDILRGFVEAAMQVVSIRMSNEKSDHALGGYYLTVSCAYVLTVLLFPVLARIWVGAEGISWFVIISIAFSSGVIAIFRVTTTQWFFTDSSLIYHGVWIAIASKLGFVAILAAIPSMPALSYLVQGVVLLMLLVLAKRRSLSGKKV